MSPVNGVAFIVSICLICGCGNHSTQNETKLPLVEHGPGSDKAVTAEVRRVRVRNCDFSQYHPLRFSSDWLWRGGISKRVEPTYPSEAKRTRVQGKISVRVLINGNGEVEQACGDGHPLLRNAAENAALQWTFRTPKLNGENIPYIQETLVFDFVLDRLSDSRAHQ